MEASAKARRGGPSEDPIDLEDPGWGGVVPVRTVFGVAEADVDTPGEHDVPASLVGYDRGVR